MDVKKIVTTIIIFIILLAISTVVISQIKPQMHKTILFEQIIFKKGSK